MTPDNIGSKTIKDLAKVVFIERAGERYGINIPRFLFFLTRHLIKVKLDEYKMQHPNLDGDSMENLIKVYLKDKTKLFDHKLGDLGDLSEIRPHHFVDTFSKKLYKEDFPELFDRLDRADKYSEYIEIDVIANHSEGFSVIIESKYCLNYENAEKYYFEGTQNKGSEQRRLKVLYTCLENHPDKKELLDIPLNNRIVPVFVINKVGNLFQEQDDILKVVPLEIMFSDQFYELVKRYLGKIE